MESGIFGMILSGENGESGNFENMTKEQALVLLKFQLEKQEEAFQEIVKDLEGTAAYDIALKLRKSMSRALEIAIESLQREVGNE